MPTIKHRRKHSRKSRTRNSRKKTRVMRGGANGHGRLPGNHLPSGHLSGGPHHNGPHPVHILPSHPSHPDHPLHEVHLKIMNSKRDTVNKYFITTPDDLSPDNPNHPQHSYYNRMLQQYAGDNKKSNPYFNLESTKKSIAELQAGINSPVKRGLFNRFKKGLSEVFTRKANQPPPRPSSAKPVELGLTNTAAGLPPGESRLTRRAAIRNPNPKVNLNLNEDEVSQRSAAMREQNYKASAGMSVENPLRRSNAFRGQDTPATSGNRFRNLLQLRSQAVAAGFEEPSQKGVLFAQLHRQAAEEGEKYGFGDGDSAA